jgi:pimeloyl-ACP methyl ester carboxylesterase
VEVGWSNRDSVIDYLVAYRRVLAGNQRSFDEAVAREFVQRDVSRARNFASARNHDVLANEASSDKPLSAIAVPTLVIHGTADPMFPIEHAQALAHEIRGATFLPLEGSGHGVERADWRSIADAILDHTERS